MKKILLSLLIVSFTLFAESEIFLAVRDFTGKAVSQDDAEAITDKIRDQMQKRSLFKVMARKEMSDIIMEQEFQQTGMCNTDQCAAELGQFLGVNYIVTGSIGKVGRVYYITLKVINVTTGEIAYSISDEYSGAIEDLLTTHAAEVVDALEVEVKKKTMGTISVAADKDSATVTINGSEKGLVPFTSDYLHPGEYTLSLSKPTFATIMKKVDLKAGDKLTYSFEMEHSDAYKKEQAAIARKEKKKKQWVRRAIFGAVAAGFAGAGIYFNKEFEAADDRLVIAKNAYINAPVGSDFTTLRNNMSDAEKSLDGYKVKRGLCYGASGAFTVGLIISIPF